MVTNFYSAWFCPYAQRAWLTLLHHGIPFQYIESLIVNENQESGSHGYTKNSRLVELNPKGLVPTLEVDPDLVELLDESNKNMLYQKNNVWVMTESIDCMVFLNTFAMTKLEGKQDLIPDDPSSLLMDANTFNQKICSTFYKILVRPNIAEQKEAFAFFAASIAEFLQKVQEGGYYKSENYPTIVDFTVIPWLLRIPLLTHYRPTFRLDEYLSGEDGDKLTRYLSIVQSLDTVQKTLWKDENDLIAVYKRYANGSAKSQVGIAVSTGKNAHDV